MFSCNRQKVTVLRTHYKFVLVAFIFSFYNVFDIRASCHLVS